MCDLPPKPLTDVGAAVNAWVADTECLLAQAQTALESLRLHPGVAPDAQQTIYQLLVLMRQRRATAPTPDAVAAWLRALASTGVHRVPRGATPASVWKRIGNGAVDADGAACAKSRDGSD
jgi:hypothetical protein